MNLVCKDLENILLGMEEQLKTDLSIKILTVPTEILHSALTCSITSHFPSVHPHLSCTSILPSALPATPL